LNRLSNHFLLLINQVGSSALPLKATVLALNSAWTTIVKLLLTSTLMHCSR
jgi:hypothetical protein